jgi:hypothetical protein
MNTQIFNIQNRLGFNNNNRFPNCASKYDYKVIGCRDML